MFIKWRREERYADTYVVCVCDFYSLSPVWDNFGQCQAIWSFVCVTSARNTRVKEVIIC